MSEPRVTIPHIRALDGLRGAAVTGVLLYHGGHLLGGYLGVDLFFVLSGFLITSLLLAEWHATDHVSLGAFWLRRARRLLPALGLVLLGVVAYCLFIASSDELGRIRGDAFGTIAYVANWRAIFAGQSYAELFTRPSPLQHTWSLAIEEQFYLVWPVLFFGITRVAKRRTAVAVLGTAVVLGAISVSLMFVLYRADDLNRVYYGTDTRAFALFAGIAIAAAIAAWGHPRDPLLRIGIEGIAFVSIAALAVMWSRVDQQSAHLYRGGFLVAGIAAAVVCLAASNPRRGPVGWLLSFPPLCWLGLISYGLYLWHWPVDIVLDSARTGLTGWPLFALRSAVALAIATASYRFVELPIRRQTFRIPRPLVAIPALTGALVLAVLVTTAGATNPPSSGAAIKGDGRDIPLAVVGDSVAHSLAPGFARAGIPIHDWWIGGCRLVPGTLVHHPEFDRRCPWEQSFRLLMSYWKPRQIVLLIGDWDLFDVRPPHSSATVVGGSPEWEVQFRRQYRRALRIFVDHGARVTALTVPCARPVPGATPLDPGSSDVARVEAANRVIEQVGAEFPGRVQVADLFAHVCPAGRFAAVINGRKVRADNVHLSADGAEAVVQWLEAERLLGSTR